MSSNNKYVKEFLGIVCSQVRIKGVHEDITEELKAHIEDQKDFYVKKNFDEETAFLKSVKDMGDPVLVGKQLDMIHRPKTEWSILVITAVLVVIAGIVQYLLSRVGSDYCDNFLGFIKYAPLGIVAFCIMYFFDYTIIQRYSKIAYFAILIIMIMYFKFINPIGAYVIAYYCYHMIIPTIITGVIYNFRGKGYLGIIYSGLFCAGALLPYILEPTASFLFLVIYCLIILTVAIEKGFFGGNKKLSLAIIYCPTLIMMFITVESAPLYMLNRITGFLNPASDPFGMGYLPHIIKSLLSGAQPIGTTVLTDNLTGKSIEQLLPEWGTGFSFTYIIAKFGYIFAVGIVVILIMLILRMIKSVYKQKNAYGFLLSFSACIIITTQIFMYILSNIGLMFPSSVTLPFISFGASSFILNMGLMGLLLSVYRRTDIVKDKFKISDIIKL